MFIRSPGSAISKNLLALCSIPNYPLFLCSKTNKSQVMKEESKYAGTEIPLEASLRQQLYNALQGDALTHILKEAKVGKTENPWRHILEGHSFKVDEKISGKLYRLFNEVKESLEFPDPIDFYISSNSEINAFAVSRLEKDEPHIININSGLLQLMTNDELKFITGHEIGHLISKNADLHKLIYFVFPKTNTIPGLLLHKVRLWNQLSELIADRFGFIANPDLSVSISAFFKMSSGLDTQRVDLDISAFLEENERRLEFFMKDEGMNIATHPINPVRVKALELFSRTNGFVTDPDHEEVIDDEEFGKQIDDLTEILLKIKNTELDFHISHYIASAGLILAGLDKQADEDEMEWIIGSLSDMEIFPRSFLQQIHETGKVPEIFSNSIRKILEINPSERRNMLIYMINMAIADKQLKKEEMDFIFNAGEKMFGFTKKEVAQIFSGIIQQRYVPSIYDLS